MPSAHTATPPGGEPWPYVDRKRLWWTLSLLYPLMPLSGIAAHALSGAEIALVLPLVIGYGLIPLLDYFVGEDEDNPPEQAVPRLEQEGYYRWLTWATVPLHFVALIGCAWWAGTQDLSWWALLLLACVAGIGSGLG